MRISLTIIFFLLVTADVRGQQSPLKYGQIEIGDLTAFSYPKDESSAAVVLLDYGEAHLQFVEHPNDDPEAKLIYTRHVRIKIRNAEAVALGDVSIPLTDFGYKGDQRISILKGITYNLENGKIVESPLSKENIFKENVVTNLYNQKFTMPNVRPGCIIEYVYTINSSFNLDFPNWEFQWKYPVLKSEYWAIAPKEVVFEKYMQGYLAPFYEVKNDNVHEFAVKVHHWIAEDVPAFQAEPHMTCEADFISKIHLSFSGITTQMRGFTDVTGSWSSIGKLLMKASYFGDIVTKSTSLRENANEITVGITDSTKKAEAIYDFVKRTIKWNELDTYMGGNPKKLLERKTGSSADINLLLGALLTQAGLKVRMMLLSTRDHGIIRKQYPEMRQFNYVICNIKIAGKEILLDATQPLLPMGMLPEKCLNGEGLTLTATDYQWKEIAGKIKAKTTISGDFELDPNGNLKGKIDYSKEGYSAFIMRKAYSFQGEPDYLKSFLREKNWIVEKSEILNVKDLSLPVKESYAIVIEEHASLAGDVIYINPFVNSKGVENPFKLETRVYPVDFGTLEETLYFCKIKIPDGYVIDEIPKSKAIALPGVAARYSYNAVTMDNTINITSTFQINKTQFVQYEYPSLREFYSQVIDKQSEQIVIRKK